MMFVCPLVLMGQTGFEKNKDHLNGLFFNVGYVQSNLLNTQYNNHKLDGNLKNGFGYIVGVQYNRLPFILDLIYFQSSFSLKGLLSPSLFPEPTVLYHNGLEGAASIALLHDVKLLTPFVGVGYQSASLKTPTITEDNDDRYKAESSVNLSSPILKAGLIFNFGRNLGLRVEYKRNMFLKENNHSYNQIGITINYRT